MLLALERKNRFSSRHRSFCYWTERREKCLRAAGSTSAAVLAVKISALDCNCPFSADISATRPAALMLPIARKHFSQRAGQWQKLRCWLPKRFFRSSTSSITTVLSTNADLELSLFIFNQNRLAKKSGRFQKRAGALKLFFTIPITIWFFILNCSLRLCSNYLT